MKVKLQKNVLFSYNWTKKYSKQAVRVTIDAALYYYPDADVMDGDDRFECDINFVYLDGSNIKPLLEMLLEMDDIIEAAMVEASILFTKENIAA